MKSSIMDVLFKYPNTTIIGASASGIIVIYCIIRQFRASKIHQPPEAAGGWPILGHLLFLTGPELPHHTLGGLADKYGPIFKIRIGIHPAVVVSSREIAKECFTKHDEVISSRPKLAAGKHMGYDYASIGYTPYGPYWREIRKITMSELLSNRRIEMFRNIRESETSTCLRELHANKVMRLGDLNKDYMPIEMKEWFGNLNLNVILRMIAGKRFNFETGTTTSEKDKGSQVRNTIREFFHLAGLFVPADAIPFLEWFDVGGYENEMKKTAKEMETIFSEWLDEHRQKMNSCGEAAKAEQDFMDVLLSVLDDFKTMEYDADTINKATTMTLLAGGSDTIAVTLTWALSLLLNNPEALRKMQDELDKHVGRERFVRELDIGMLPYCQAVVNETFRLYPAAPLGAARELMQDCIIGGFHVPAGSRLIVNVHKLHRDPRVWEGPDEFRPERFLVTHKNIDLKSQHFELMPFGAGRRACPGEGHGIQIVQLVLPSFVHAFDIMTTSSGPVDMTGSPGLTNMKATPLQVLIKPRLFPSAYT